VTQEPVGPMGPTVVAYLQTLVANIERSLHTGHELEDGHLSPAEIKLMEAFTRIGLEPRQQHPIGAYAADFYFDDVQIVVEVDGKQHADRWQQDRRRDLALAKKGIRTFRIPAALVFRDADGCAAAVRGLIDAIHIDRMADR
jgi:very-short-patch-repair endonuclease